MARQHPGRRDLAPNRWNAPTVTQNDDLQESALPRACHDRSNRSRKQRSFDKCSAEPTVDIYDHFPAFESIIHRGYCSRDCNILGLELACWACKVVPDRPFALMATSVPRADRTSRKCRCVDPPDMIQLCVHKLIRSLQLRLPRKSQTSLEPAAPAT